jgi:hypothetical protein
MFLAGAIMTVAATLYAFFRLPESV